MRFPLATEKLVHAERLLEILPGKQADHSAFRRSSQRVHRRGSVRDVHSQEGNRRHPADPGAFVLFQAGRDGPAEEQRPPVAQRGTASFKHTNNRFGLGL